MRTFPAVLIDLFDFDPKKQQGRSRIVIQGLENRKQNIGSEALLTNMRFTTLIYINCMQILAPKMKQVRLFLLFGSECIGIKKGI
jgi:diamine N-acetyltransferase